MLIATNDTVYEWSRDPAPATQPRSIWAGGEVRALAVRGGCRLIGSDDGLHVVRSSRDTLLLTEISASISSLLLTREEPLCALAGTEGAHLLAVDGDGVQGWIDAFDALSCRAHWHTPWGGPPAVRSLAASSDGRTIYADIHVGSIMRSDNAGLTWSPVDDAIHEDVHQVSTSAAAPHRVYANTANAVFVSDDRGQSWTHRCAGLSQRYGRAIAVHPAAPDCLLASVSDGPHGGRGRLYRSVDAGEHWQHVKDGFPAETQRNIDTFHVAFDGEGTAWCAVEADLYRSTDRGLSWNVYWQAPARIKSIACDNSG